MMITLEQMKDAMNAGANVLSDDGAVLGSMGQLYVDDATGEPSWVTVATHAAGSPESFAPLREATLDGRDVRLPYPHSMVYDSPKMSQDGHLSPEEEQHLLRYYGLLPASDETARASSPSGDRFSRTDASTNRSETRSDGFVGGSVDDDDVSMTRSEEQLRVGTELRETERVRLVKRVVTEDVTMTVQIRREELVVERVPVQDGAPLYDDGAGTFSKAERERLYSAVETAFNGDVVEMVLYEEKPRVEVDVVPIERIRVTREARTHDEVVTGQVRKEVIETERIEL
ncbi:photosystem reaction center subunit H [Arthrobacter pityocampae]|uniref:Photosystem reaction center subunit H n=1 Tax=Arthrobacter pityocampae TaxID=547334 RepID=A0A2S5IWB1_9MICC|nr:YsnF/AvaK domain-containing protein [Arthrobacter pityocampae]PPB48820.1 photosystem reaction center subunit H [Arthrobacter pityocampae]